MTDKERAEMLLLKAKVEGGKVAFENVKNLMDGDADVPPEIYDEVVDAIALASIKLSELEDELKKPNE
jgi:hypothetical protein